MAGGFESVLLLGVPLVAGCGGGGGQIYSSTTLDPAFQKDGLNVQFSATVIDNGAGGADGAGGVYITITSIHVL